MVKRNGSEEMTHKLKAKAGEDEGEGKAYTLQLGRCWRVKRQKEE